MEKFKSLYPEDIENLGILKKMGLSAELTDYAILKGAHVVKNTNFGFWTAEVPQENLDSQSIWVVYDDLIKGINYGAIRNINDQAYTITDEEEKRFTDGGSGFNEKSWIESRLGYPVEEYINLKTTNLGIRPAFFPYIFDPDLLNVIKNENGITEFEYFKYPKTIINQEYSKILENSYKDFIRNSKSKEPAECYYEYNGTIYCRMRRASHDSKGHTLSDGTIIPFQERAFWLNIEPIVWLYDEQEKIALSKQIIDSGVELNNIYCEYGITESSLSRYLKEGFYNRLVRDNVLENKIIIDKNATLTELLRKQEELQQLINSREEDLKKNEAKMLIK